MQIGTILHYQVIHDLSRVVVICFSFQGILYRMLWLVTWKLPHFHFHYYIVSIFPRSSIIFYRRLSGGGKLCYISTHFFSFCRFSLCSEVSWKRMSIYWCIIAVASSHSLINKRTRSRITSCR